MIAVAIEALADLRAAFSAAVQVNVEDTTVWMSVKMEYETGFSWTIVITVSVVVVTKEQERAWRVWGEDARPVLSILHSHLNNYKLIT